MLQLRENGASCAAHLARYGWRAPHYSALPRAQVGVPKGSTAVACPICGAVNKITKSSY